MAAQLIGWLAHTGSRLSDGTANASGKAYFYAPGSTQTQVTVYSNVDGTSALSQPVTLNAAGKATVYTTQQVRIRIETSAGVEVTDTDRGNAVRAENVEVENAGFNGTLSTGATGAGGRTTQNAVLTSLFNSVGGTDAKYKESGGATERNIKDKFSEIWLSVKDFGAVGDGVAVDTTAIQATINRADALNGGIVYFPPGTYKIDAALTLSSQDGVSFRGAGSHISIISNTSSTANAFTITSCDGFNIEDLQITNSDTAATGTAIALASCTYVSINRVIVKYHGEGVAITGTTAVKTWITSCSLVTSTNGKAIDLNTTSGNTLTVIGSELGASGGTTVSLAGTFTGVHVSGCRFTTTDATGVSVGSSITQVQIIGNTDLYLCTAPISLPALDRLYYQYGNNVDGYTVSVANGVAHAPDFAKGHFVGITATGATATLSNPKPDITGISRHGSVLYTTLKNAAGGTTWTLGASYQEDGAIDTGASVQTNIIWIYNYDTLSWVEMSRVVI